MSNAGVENIKLGACDVTFGGVSLGLTKGGVEVSVETESHLITVDQFGATAVSERIMGRNVTVKVPMAETDLEKLAAIMPGSSISAGKDAVTISVGEGIDLIKLAKELVLTPRSEGDYPVRILKAATKGSMSFAYKYDEERVFELEFTAYPSAAGEIMVVGALPEAPARKIKG